MNNLETLASQIQSAETTADGAEILREWIEKIINKQPSISIESNWVDGGAVRIDKYISLRRLKLDMDKRNLIGEQDE